MNHCRPNDSSLDPMHPHPSAAAAESEPFQSSDPYERMWKHPSDEVRPVLTYESPSWSGRQGRPERWGPPAQAPQQLQADHDHPRSRAPFLVRPHAVDRSMAFKWYLLIEQLTIPILMNHGDAVTSPRFASHVLAAPQSSPDLCPCRTS